MILGWALCLPLQSNAVQNFWCDKESVYLGSAWLACVDLMPLITPSSFGMAAIYGSGSSWENWRCLMADKLPLIDEWDTWSGANCAANRHKLCSLTGKGVTCARVQNKDNDFELMCRCVECSELELHENSVPQGSPVPWCPVRLVSDTEVQ